MSTTRSDFLFQIPATPEKSDSKVRTKKTKRDCERMMKSFAVCHLNLRNSLNEFELKNILTYPSAPGRGSHT